MEDVEYWDGYWTDNKSKKTPFNSLVSLLRKGYFARAFASSIAGLADIRGKSICELGSGSALTLKYLKKLGAGRCAGIDYSPKAIAYGKENFPDGDFMLADLLDIPASLAGSFDIVYSLGLLEHFSKDNQRKLLHAHRVLAKEAIYIEVPHDMIAMRMIFAVNKIWGRTTTFSDEELFRERTFRDLGLEGRVVQMPGTFFLTIGYFENF